MHYVSTDGLEAVLENYSTEIDKCFLIDDPQLLFWN